MNLKEKFKIAKERIISSKRVLVIGHLRPDGDAISACSAMLEILKGFNKKAWGFCSGHLPEFFDFLPNFYQISSSISQLKKQAKINESDDNFLNFFDLIFVVDCGSLARTNLSKEIKKIKINKKSFIIEFDHHPAVDNYADLEIRQPLSASTTELIYDFYSFLNWPLNKKIATCLLTGLITDTANFFYPNVSAKSLKIASKLLLAGANLSEINKQIAVYKNIAAFKLWGLAMDRLQIHPIYSFASSVLTLKDLRAINSDPEEISEILGAIAGFLSNLANVKATLLLYQTADNMIKGNLRSSDPNIDVAKLAKLFYGGGHPQAAGFSLAANLVKTDFGWQVK
jgi:bifunctional oligoribonuclease and PAP phosphatase NrnA